MWYEWGCVQHSNIKRPVYSNRFNSSFLNEVILQPFFISLFQSFFNHYCNSNVLVEFSLIHLRRLRFCEILGSDHEQFTPSKYFKHFHVWLTATDFFCVYSHFFLLCAFERNFTWNKPQHPPVFLWVVDLYFITICQLVAKPSNFKVFSGYLSLLSLIHSHTHSLSLHFLL